MTWTGVAMAAAQKPPSISLYRPSASAAAPTDTFVYPHDDRYAFRPYQHAIVQSALRANTLVSLPTGTGKTLIAATVMYNFMRWFPNAIAVFMAPTRPLISQQRRNCCDILGLDAEEHAQLLTGEEPPAVRTRRWAASTGRLVFCTPQTLDNDLAAGLCDASAIACLVFDEAHHAAGTNAAYALVARRVREARGHVRMLALSATAGTTIGHAQAVIDHLQLATLEVRHPSASSAPVRSAAQPHAQTHRSLSPPTTRCAPRRSSLPTCTSARPSYTVCQRSALTHLTPPRRSFPHESCCCNQPPTPRAA